jgi:hypothetical protein
MREDNLWPVIYPVQTIEDSAAGTKLYFERYGETALEFPANDVTAAVSFFRKAGFDMMLLILQR